MTAHAPEPPDKKPDDKHAAKNEHEKVDHAQHPEPPEHGVDAHGEYRPVPPMDVPPTAAPRHFSGFDDES